MGWDIKRELKSQIAAGTYPSDTKDTVVDDVPADFFPENPHYFVRHARTNPATKKLELIPILNAFASFTDGCSYFRSRTFGDYMPTPRSNARRFLEYIHEKFPEASLYVIVFDNYARIPEYRADIVHTDRPEKQLPPSVVENLTIDSIDKEYRSEDYWSDPQAKHKIWIFIYQALKEFIEEQAHPTRQYIVHPPNLYDDAYPDPFIYNMPAEEWIAYSGRTWGEGDFTMLLYALKVMTHPEFIASGKMLYLLTGDWDIYFQCILCAHPKLAILFNNNCYYYHLTQEMCYSTKTVYNKLKASGIKETPHFLQKHSTRYHEVVQLQNMSLIPHSQRLHLLWWFLHGGCDYCKGMRCIGFTDRFLPAYCLIDAPRHYTDNMFELIHNEKGQRQFIFYPYRYLFELVRCLGRGSGARCSKTVTMCTVQDNTLKILWSMLYYILWDGNRSSRPGPLFYQTNPEKEYVRPFKANMYRHVCRKTPTCTTYVCHCTFKDILDDVSLLDTTTTELLSHKSLRYTEKYPMPILTSFITQAFVF